MVTGAAGGIGAAFARRMVAEGAHVMLADFNGDGARKLAEELGQAALQVDLTRQSDIDGMVDECCRRFGRIDLLFNNAGVAQAKRLLDITPADWDWVHNINLKAVFFVAQACAKRMLNQEPAPGSELRGKLIHTASIAAFRGMSTMMSHYGVSKAGVVYVARVFANAFAGAKITSNAICPGVVDTAMWEKIDSDWTSIEGWERGEAWRRRSAGIPIGRTETPDDLLGALTFLASADSDYMTGQALIIDGGMVTG